LLAVFIITALLLTQVLTLVAFAGTNEWTRDGLDNEYVFSIAFSPGYAIDGMVFAATASGLYRSSDGGKTWVYGGLANCSSVAFSPNFENDNTIFSGSGGAGSDCSIYKSVDGGMTWSQVKGGLASVESIVVSPNFAADNTIFAGTYGYGIYKSTDGGDTWLQDTTSFTNIRSLAISPAYSSDNTIFAACASGGFKSTDGGQSWIRADSGISFIDVYSVAVSPNYTVDGTVFAGTPDNSVYKSTDGGQNWTQGATGIANTRIFSVAVSPNYAIDSTVFAGTLGRGVFKSTDGGQSWGEVTGGLMDPVVRTVALSPNYINDNTVFAGTVSGIYSYTEVQQPPPPNGSLNWTTKTPMLDPTSRAASAVVSGVIFVLGGSTATGATSGVHAYDPGSDTWLQMPPLSEPRGAGGEATLGDTVYIAGGGGLENSRQTVMAYSTSSGQCDIVGNLTTDRFRTSATILNNKLYVVGGQGLTGTLDSIEEYDLSTNTSVFKTMMPGPRQLASAVTLGDKIYIIGGTDGNNAPTDTCWEYDPATDILTAKSPMPIACAGKLAVTANGKIYIVGGITGGGFPPTAWINDIQEYDPATDTWQIVGTVPTSRYAMMAQIVDNTLYVIGGDDGTQNLAVNEAAALASAPDTGEFNWMTMSPMTSARVGAASGVVNGNIFVLGGSNRLDPPPSGALDHVEMYNPATDMWLLLSPLSEPRFSAADATLGDTVYIVGGTRIGGPEYGGPGYTNTVLAYNTSDGTCTQVGTINAARFRADADIIDGRIYIVGGWGDSGPLDSIEEYDIATNTNITKTTLSEARDLPSVISCGSKLYIIGGFDSNGNPVNTCWEYDPATNMITDKAPLPLARGGDRGSVILNGCIYVFGGATNPGPPPITTISDIQKYDPTTDTWEVVGSLSTPRWGFVSEVVGQSVYLIGGSDDQQVLALNEAGTTDMPPGPDTIAPTTIADLSGDTGNYDWFRSDVTVQLTATDAGGSGVTATEYSFDGAEWYPYITPFVVSTEGTTVAYYRSSDNAGNVEATQERYINIDKTSPASTGWLSGTPGLNGWYISNVQVNLTASDSGGSGLARIEWSFDHVQWHLYTGPFTLVDEGIYYIYYRAVDNAGNVEPYIYHGWTFGIDKNAPVTMASLSGTQGQNGWYTSNVQVTLSKSDNAQGSGAAKTQYSFDGTNWSNYTTPLTIGNEGATTVYYRSEDFAGNVEAAKSSVIRIDKTMPVTTIGVNPTIPDGANGWYVTVPSITLSANEGADLFYKWDDGAASVYNAPVLAPEGDHMLHVYAVDVAGNTEAVQSMQLKVDTLAPSTPVLDSVGAINAAGASSVMVRGMADVGSTVYITASDGTNEISATATSGGTFSADLDLTTLADGTVIFTVYTQDQAGNESPVSLAVTATKDTVIPETTATVSGSAGDNGWYVSDVQVSLTATDGASGVTETEYSFDGASWVPYSNPVPITTEGVTVVYYRSTDNVGNMESVKELSLRIDKTTPSVTSTDPADGAIGVALNHVITIVFSEDIWAGDTFSDISISRNKQTLAYSTSITGNVLTISANEVFGRNNTYVVTIPSGALHDTAGNALAAPHTLSFTTTKNK
jgi:N-acetylneuraminic acid mutarotase